MFNRPGRFRRLFCSRDLARQALVSRLSQRENRLAVQALFSPALAASSLAKDSQLRKSRTIMVPSFETSAPRLRWLYWCSATPTVRCEGTNSSNGAGSSEAVHMYNGKVQGLTPMKQKQQLQQYELALVDLPPPRGRCGRPHAGRRRVDPGRHTCVHGSCCLC